MAINKGVKIGNITYPNQVEADNVVTTTTKQFASATEKAKWNAPAAADVVTDSNHQFVTAAEKESWGISGGMPVYVRSGTIRDGISWRGMWFGGVLIYNYTSSVQFGATWNHPYPMDTFVGVSGHVPNYYSNAASSLSGSATQVSYSKGCGANGEVAQITAIGFRESNPFASSEA